MILQTLVRQWNLKDGSKDPLLRFKDSISMTRTKRYGDRGSHCRKPLELGKNPARAPLILTENMAEVTQALIQLMKVGGNLNLDMISNKNSHLTVSNALRRSILRAQRGGPEDLW